MRAPSPATAWAGLLAWTCFAFVLGWSVHAGVAGSEGAAGSVATKTPSARAAAAPAPPQASGSPAVPEPAPPPAAPVELPGSAWPLGTWVSAANGDAIPDGPFGGKIAVGGSRLVFVRGRKGSKTPWNLRAWLGRTGGDGVRKEVLTLGCGYYPSGTAFCRGDGAEHAVRTTIRFTRDGDLIRVQIPDLLDETVRPR